MRSLTIVAIVVLVAAVVIIGGSAAFLLTRDQKESGQVSIYVKDVPATWKHVNVTFSEVRIHEANDSSNSTGWHNLALTGPRTIDLASLVDVSDLLAQGNVSVGKYTQIRIVVTNVTGVMTDGTLVNFTVPSGELKTTHPFNVTKGSTTKLTLDIDLAHSIVQDGSVWKFKPVLGSIVQG